ncbi:MAG: hypothetical protein IKN74_04030 [Clostridia bacterium]|nr:hypothetical protein [Clostridia bacterium]
MENEKVLERTAFDYSKTADMIQTILIALIALLVPTFLAKLLSLAFGTALSTQQSQLIVGSIVNTALVLTALNLKGWKKILLVVTMPSISTIINGYVFGPLNMVMIYQLPAIWLGNFALIFAFKYLLLGKKVNFYVTGAIGIAVKVAIIFGSFVLINKGFGLVPAKAVSTLQTAMSVTQLYTATIGVVISSLFYFSMKHIDKKEVKE